ncbi:MAG TPA: carboxypeptidase-like regulatory domain-containing protein [Vicinamibacteria bacterium]|nr:carboxypeptidase-like regulatory domain-containing protein [Vicinamibacteria bacterium]
MRTRSFFPALIWALAATATAAEITGRVLSENKGVVGATVSAIPYETRHAAALREARGTPAPAPLASASASADGRFKLVVPVTAPPFVVRVTFGGLAARTFDGVFERNDTEDIGEISLSRGDTVAGRVVGPDGKPVTGALVRIGRDGEPTTTGKDGLFRFDDVSGRSGQAFITGSGATLSVNAAGFETQAAAARFSGAPATVRLKAATARLSGVLRDAAGKPAIDAVARVAADSVTRWVRTDASGRFEIPGPPAKQGRLEALGRDGSSLEITVPAGAARNTFTLARAAAIEGRVTQIDNGRLVPGVKVTARASGHTVVARTGVDGRYRIAGLPQGAYRLTFDEKRFVLVDRREVEVAAGETKALGIALTPAVALTGRVSDEKGQPVAGAKGTLSVGAESRMGMMFRNMGRDGAEVAFTSGADGTFKATRLAPGSNQKLTVTHPDFERRVVPGVDLLPGAPRPLSVDVVLSTGFVLTGVVKDKDGLPVADASVTLNRSVTMTGGRGGNVMSFSTIESVRPQAETDFEGKFGFKGLSAGEYDVTTSKTGFTRSVSNGVKAGDGSTPLSVTLSPGASISGRLLQPNGFPVTGYSISARPSAAGAGGAMMTGRGGNFSPTDPDGGFILDGLTPGTAYDLSIFGPGEFRGDPRKKNVVAPAADVEIEVATRGRIAGRVLDAAAGAPITDFEASLSPARAGGMQIVVRMGTGDDNRRTPFSSPDGSFAFEDVAPGNWDVTVWAKTYQEARTGGIAVAPGETKTVEVKAARGLVIRGRVVDAKGGRGVQDATISVRDASGGGGAFVFDPGGLGGGVITDADGHFEIVDKGPGSYQVTARHTLFSEGTARVTLEDKDGTVEIPLLGGGTIGGLVISSQGAPLAGASVTLQNGGEGVRFNGMGLDGQTSLTDGAGRFRFEHLAAGRYKLGATLRTEASPTIDVPLNAGDVREDIRLALDAGAVVRGLVSGLPENERVGLMVGAQGAEDYFANTRTGPGGAFEFAGVPKGTLTLRATAGDLILGSSRTAVKEVMIREGQAEVSTEIAFEDGLSISGTVMRRGAPVVGARVAAFMTGTGRQASARVDESGAFRIVGLEAGRVNVTAFSEAFESQVSQVVELSQDTSIDLVIPTARFWGTVVDGSTTLPLEAAVEVQRVAPASGSAGGRMVMNTDSSGRFSFDDLEPVDYRVTARRSGYESATQTVKPTDAGEDLRIELKRGSGLSVEAKDAQMGFGLRSLFVRVQAGQTDTFTGMVTLDGEGKGEIPGIPPGSYSVTAQSSGYAPVRVPNVLAPSTVVRLAFTPGGAVEFRTTEDFLKDGPKSGQLVSLSGSPMSLGQGPNSFRLSRLTQRMENLSPGRYRLTLDGGIEKTFDVTEGGVAMVAIP